jgi:integrase
MGALREAALLGITDRHLGQGVRRPKIGEQTSATWTAEEAKTALRAVRDDPIFGALYHVAIATGLRPGELRALMWEDVNLDAGLITVRRTITKDEEGAEIIAPRTKSKRSRAVAISPATVARLKWHRARQHERQLAHDDWQAMGLVFDRGDGHWLYTSHWQRAHRDLCQRAGVPTIRFHDLRHTSASLELAAGTHPKVVADRLGHTSIEMTINRYSHVTAELQRSAADAFAERYLDDEDSATKRATN